MTLEGRWGSALSLGIWALLGGTGTMVGCGSADDVDAESGGVTAANQTACSDFNWRAETPGTVVCPGADSCSCAATACCTDFDSQNYRVSGASCEAATACAGPVLTCDGPEDCGDGAVCCFVDSTGGGTSCKSETDCFGDVVVCRSDDDCGLGRDCVPAEAGSYLEDVAGYCK